jgi:DNA processing protein
MPECQETGLGRETLVAISMLRLGFDTSAARLFAALGPDGRDRLARERDPVRVFSAWLGIPPAEQVKRSGQFRTLAEAAMRRAERTNTTLITCADDAYPPLLRHIPDPPLALWVRGPGGLAPDHSVGIVGSRHPSPAGQMIARRLGAGLARASVAVVSGLAHGIDGAAHEGAVEAGGVTIAVLGSGPDVIYPAAHRPLADRLLARGTIVSEFPPGMRPRPSHFPLRNRIISGLCAGVVVIEAPEKSGSLITARAALEQGREVMAVPGNVLSGGSRGCHALIKDGAVLVETVEDILGQLGWTPQAGTRVAPSGNLSLFSDLQCEWPVGDVVQLDELGDRSGRPAAELLPLLARLELSGTVARVPGGGFVRLDGPDTNRSRGQD